MSKAMLLEPLSLDDSHFREQLSRQIGRKKADAKIGRLLFNGCYSTMISDPYAQASHIFGLGVSPLLKEGEYYSHYWNSLGIKKTAAIRSPIVHSSEVNILEYRDDEVVRNWYRYINSGIIYPASGIGMDYAIHSGSDFDGDEVCTINHPVFMEKRAGGLPILYSPKKAPKEIIESSFGENVTSAQYRSFGTKIGFITNVGSSMYSLLSNYPKGSKEYSTILGRLKYFRILQGEEIDSAKTGNSQNYFPEHFVKYKKIGDDVPDDRRKDMEYNNSILGNKRPAFMRWLYPEYQRKYKNEMSVFNGASQTRWSLPFQELLLLNKKDRSDEQEKLVQRYYKSSFFIENNSPMNRLSRVVSDSISAIGTRGNKLDSNFDFEVYLSKNYHSPSKRNIEKMLILLKEYRSLKRSLRYKNAHDEDNIFDNVEQISSHINRRAYLTITSNAEELGDLAVYVSYKVSNKSSRSFVWGCFGDEIVENMIQKRGVRFVRVPHRSKDGHINYLWAEYSIFNESIDL
jgi:hypothetical protein